MKNYIKGIIIYGLFISLLILLFSSCKTQNIYISGWNDKPKGVISGRSNFINNLQYKPDAKMMYGIMNDNENLYVFLEISDKTVQRKVLMGGLTFWMDTVGKKKKQLGITFPLKGSMKNQQGKKNRENMMNQRQNKNLRTDIDNKEVNKKFESGFNKMEIVGFNNENEPMVVFNQNPKGVSAKIKFDNKGILNYMASVPLKLIFNNVDEFLSDKTKLFSFGFETGKIETPLMVSGKKPGGGGRPGGGRSGGGKPGGGRNLGASSIGGRGAGSRMGGMQELTKPSKFWVKSASLANTDTKN